MKSMELINNANKLPLFSTDKQKAKATNHRLSKVEIKGHIVEVSLGFRKVRDYL